MSDTVTYTYAEPPAQGVWWDARVVGDDVMRRLRLRTTDLDRPRVDAAVAEAGELINDRLDRVNDLAVDDAPPALLNELREVAVEVYLRRNVSTDGVVGDILAGISPVDVAAPDLDYAHKSRWGIA